jgi:small-conductance mechanosensitive channel
MNPNFQLFNQLSQLNQILNAQFLPIGKTTVSLTMLIYVAVLFFLLVIATARAKTWFERELLSRTKIEPGMRAAAGSFLRGFVLFVGFIVILQTAGIDLSALTVVAGAVGLGVSLGLQGLISNVVSGVIIVLEGPFKVGDRIEFDGTIGSVMRVALRTTTIVTNDNVAIIVPNSELLKGKITNWSCNASDVKHSVRFTFPVSADGLLSPSTVIEAILEAANAHTGVLSEPAPEVVLQDLGEKTNSYLLRVYTSEFLSKPSTLRSELNHLIFDVFRKRNIKFSAGDKS